MKTDSGGRRGIQSVEIGMRVLAAVAKVRGPSTLSSIAQRAGISVSQTHRYLSSLMAADMVLQEGPSGLYDLAAGAIRMGVSALSRIDAFSAADAFMKQLVIDTRRTGFVAVWGDFGPTIVRWYPGSPPVITALMIGSGLPLMRSATGRAFYAFGDRTEMERQARLVETSDPASIPADIDAFREEIVAAGHAAVSGDLIPGLRAVAAPVFDLQGNLVMVASLLAGANFAASGDRAAAEALMNACSRISQSMGRQPPEAVQSLDAPIDAAAKRGRRKPR